MLKAVKDLEELPEALREHYVQVGDRYVPQFEATEINGARYALEDVSALRTALEGERDKRTKRQGEIEKLTAEREALQARIDELAAIDPKKEADKLAQAKVETLLAQAEGPLKERIGSLEGEVTSLDGQLRGMFERQLLAAIESAKGKPSVLFPALKNMIDVANENGKRSFQFVDPITGAAKVRVLDGGKVETITDPAMLLEQLREEPDWKDFFRGSEARGSEMRQSGKEADGGGGSDGSVRVVQDDDPSRLARMVDDIASGKVRVEAPS